MAKIRSLKPELFRSEKLAGLDLPVVFTFQGIWCEADDFGVCQDNARVLAGAIWPLREEITAADVERHLEQLAVAGSIIRYEAGGKRLLWVTGWFEHQRISKRQAPSAPPPPGIDQSPWAEWEPYWKKDDAGDSPASSSAARVDSPGDTCPVAGESPADTGHDGGDSPGSPAVVPEDSPASRAPWKGREGKGKRGECEGERDDPSPPHLAAVNDRAPGGASSRFADWWAAYPPRNGKRIGRAAAEKAWSRLKPADQAAALCAVRHYAAARGAPGQVSPKDPARWLTGREWVDWQTPESPPNARTATANAWEVPVP